MANLELALSELEHHREGDPLPADLFEEVHDAHESADRIRAIVRDLKLFSRAEEEQVGPVDIHRVLDSTARMASTEIRHRARLLKRYGEVPPVMANDARLGQVVLNLLVNAAHAIDAGDHDNNHIELRTAVDDEGWVLIQVKDSGSGMSEDVKRRLFAAFFTTKPVGVGTGLGLAISQRIVTSFGGTITVQSELGDGSCFTVRLPPAAQAAAAAPVHPVTRIVPPTRGARILVVDDEPLVTNVVRRIFPVPHEVVVCHSGAHAVGLLEIGEHYDVVLCDVMMPQVTGLELYDILAARGAGLEERMVFITGGAFTPEARARLSTLPNPCLDKPFKIPALRDVVEDIIARSRLPDA